jgi:hypothetical protein
MKASAGLVLPFLVIGAPHRRRVLEGVVAATAGVALVALAVQRGHAAGFVPQHFGQQRLRGWACSTWSASCSAAARRDRAEPESCAPVR